MINVITGRRESGEPSDDEHVTTVEGWILGQRADVDASPPPHVRPSSLRNAAVS